MKDYTEKLPHVSGVYFTTKIEYERIDGVEKYFDFSKEKKLLDELITGEISGIVYYKLDEKKELIPSVKAYLDSRGLFYETNLVNRKYGKGLEIKPIRDKEEVDGLQEDIHLRVLFHGLDKNHQRVLKSIQRSIAQMKDSKCNEPFYYFMSLELFDSIDFSTIVEELGGMAEIEAIRGQGLVLIYPPEFPRLAKPKLISSEE